MQGGRVYSETPCFLSKIEVILEIFSSKYECIIFDVRYKSIIEKCNSRVV